MNSGIYLAKQLKIYTLAGVGLKKLVLIVKQVGGVKTSGLFSFLSGKRLFLLDHEGN